MTDLPANLTAVPSRLGATAVVDERGLVVEVEPQEEELHHGVLRLSVVTFVVDVVAGVTLDTDPSAWTFTTDLTLRMRPMPAPAKVTATARILRQGGRSAHALVDVVDDHAGQVAAGAIGFAHVPRKPRDPPKPIVSPEMLVARFSSAERLARPLREEAGIVSLDPAAGVVEMAVSPEVCNPAGTIQGAMVALVAEAAVEDLVATRTVRPAVVTEIDVRYLARVETGPVRTACRSLGDTADDPIEVQIIDVATGAISTLAYARTSLLR